MTQQTASTRPTILITGATGNVGREVIKALPPQLPVRAAVMPAELSRLAPQPSVTYAAFDFLNPSTYAAAFEGIRTLFLVRPPQLANVQKEMAPAILAARAAGVEHVVFLSLQGVEKQRFVPHYKIEALLRETGMDWTFLRCGFFMQNLSTTHREQIRQTHRITLPVGKSRTSFIDVRDIGAAAAVALTEPGHRNTIYTLTGSEALDYYRVAEIFTDVLGTEITYDNPSVLRFLRAELAHGTRLGYALIMTMLYTITRFGNAAHTSPDFVNLVHRQPITLRQFVQDNRQVWA